MRWIASVKQSSRLLANPEHRKVAKFILVGSFNTGAMLGLYWLLIWLGLHYKLALTADYAVGAVLGYLLNRAWTFASQGRSKAGFPKYVATYVFVFGLNFVLLHIAVETVGMDAFWGQIPALALVTIVSYLMQRFWVFRTQ